MDICQQWYNKVRSICYNYNTCFMLSSNELYFYQQNLDSSKQLNLAEQYSYFIKVGLVEAIKHRCRCHFPITNLPEELFICEDSPNLMTYRSTLLGTHNFNGTQILGFVQDWASTSPWIKVERSRVRVESDCFVAISSLDEPETQCEQRERCLTYDDNPKYAMCAEHLSNQDVANCFEGCIFRNG